ncbi:UdgX family uracil-DNA binding protein [Rhodococcus phenolicus]|uniref:UdgX family uracil-DNA binding protein n=1 Tax=Rhodococcus phenolicus TaxID=263849 RepID=UPI00082DBBF3|nr:UdgX family uracil-DNA binding protein [Rhodococcus phenolicus]
MATHPGAQQYLPNSNDLDELASAAAGCRGCDLYRYAGPTVFGAGPATARLLLVGEQPGDQEDRAGEPFVGPAGHLLDRALEKAGVDRGDVYVTNAVKHFKFTRDAGGKRRIHKKPARGEVIACRPWLFAELEAVRPDVLVCLGATAAQALLGPSFRITEHRGQVLHADPELNLPSDPQIVATVHPSAILRMRTGREDALESLVRDLRRAASLVG